LWGPPGPPGPARPHVRWLGFARFSIKLGAVPAQNANDFREAMKGISNFLNVHNFVGIREAKERTSDEARCTGRTALASRFVYAKPLAQPPTTTYAKLWTRWPDRRPTLICNLFAAKGGPEGPRNELSAYLSLVARFQPLKSPRFFVGREANDPKTQPRSYQIGF
jgi:hypothetical protein